MLLAWLAGTAVQLFQPTLWSLPDTIGLLMGSGLLGVACACLLARTPVQKRHPQRRWVHLALAMGMLSVWSFASVNLRAWVFAQDRLSDDLVGVDLLVQGVVAGMPQWHGDGVRFPLAVSHAQRIDNGLAVELPRRIQLGWFSQSWGGERKTLPHLRAGEHWQMAVRLKPPHGLRNPGGFDAELWLWEQGVQATGHVRDGARDPPSVRLAATGQFPIEQMRQRVRERIAQTIPEPRWSGLIAALLIGDQAAIDPADWDLFRITGIAHLMSISGLHITLWAWVAQRWVSHWWRHSDRWGRSWCLRYPAPWAGLWGGVLCAGVYAVFSGWGVPAQRTLVMLLVAACLRWRALRWPSLTQWLMAAVVVVAMDPWALLQSGFWLSFVAVGILFLGTPPPHRPAPMALSLWQRAVQQARLLWREQWQISLCLAPLTVWLFQQMSLVGLLVNLFAIPWVTLVVTPLVFMGSVFSPLWVCGSWALQALCAVLEPLSQLPWAVWHLAAPPWWAGALGVMGGGVLAWSTRWRWRVLGSILLLPCFIWPVDRPAPQQVEVVVADIGQGNAVLVRTATHSLLFDTGPRFGSDSDAGQRVLVPLLQTMNERLNTLVLSHQDSDHTGGALSVQGLQPQAEVLTSITPDHWLAHKLRTRRCEAGQRWEWDGVQFDMLHPMAGDYAQQLSPNARSCVLRISANGQVVLLTADIEAFQEQALVTRSAEQLKADVLLVPHHGSKTSSTEAFLEAVQPRWALFQMGYRNRYGHPAPQVLQRYQARGIETRLSPACGAMTWRSESPDQVVCEREANRRYWQHQPE
jgi:competence protein ComEC